MKKINNNGFVLAETLIVTVFLMVLFTLIYSNFYPLIGEYEKRETYDDVDGKYAVYWIKKLIEDSDYSVSSDKLNELEKDGSGYFRFECSDFPKNSDKVTMCVNLVRSLEIKGCDESGNNCDIFVTNYSLSGGIQPDFKEHLEDTAGIYEGCTLEEYLASPGTYGKEADEAAIINEINNAYPNQTESSTDTCTGQVLTYALFSGEIYNGQEDSARRKSEMVSYLKNLSKKTNSDGKVFDSAFKDYVFSLPDYVYPSKNLAKFRVIITIQHTKDYNNYLSFATTEVNK